MKTNIGKKLSLASALVLAGAVGAFGQAFDQKAAYDKLVADTGFMTYVTSGSGASKAGAGLDLLTASLSAYAGKPYSGNNGTFTADDAKSLEAAMVELKLPVKQDGMIRSADKEPQGAFEYLKAQVTKPAVVGKDEPAAVESKRDPKTEKGLSLDKWHSIYDATQYSAVSEIVGTGSGIMGYVDMVKTAPVTLDQQSTIIDKLYATAIATTLEDAQKKLITSTQAFTIVDKLMQEYVALGEVSEYNGYKLAKMLDSVNAGEAASLLAKKMASTDDEKKLLKTLDDVVRVIQASDDMNSKFEVSTSYDLKDDSSLIFKLNDVENGTFYGDFSTHTNYPTLKAKVFDWVTLGLKYDVKTGKVYFEETGTDMAPIEKYDVKQSNLEITAMFDVLAGMKESEQYDLGLRLGLGYAARTYTQLFEGVEVARSLNTKHAAAFLGEFSVDYNAKGTILSFDAAIKSGLNTYAEQVGVEGLLEVGVKPFFNGLSAGFYGGLAFTNEPSSKPVTPYGRFEVGAKLGKDLFGSLGIDASASGSVGLYGKIKF